MQTLIVTLIFGTLALWFGIPLFSTPIMAIIHRMPFSIKWYIPFIFIFSCYMLALEYNIVPSPIKKTEVAKVSKIDTVYIYKDTVSSKPLIPFVPHLPVEIRSK